MFTPNNKHGTIAVLFTSIAFLITVIYLISEQPQLTRNHVGKEAFAALDEMNVERKINYYVSQSVRNAAYASFFDLSKQGFFPTIVGGKTCPVLEEKPLLYADVSCSYSKQAFFDSYIINVREHLHRFLATTIYGVSLTKGISYSLDLTLGDGKMTFSGKASQPLQHQGSTVTYSFPVQYQETISYDFHHFFTLLRTFEQQLPCIQSFSKQQLTLSEQAFSEALQKTCAFSTDYTWQIRKQGDVLFFTATTKEPALFLKNLAFSFAITLNNLQLPPSPTTLFS